MKKRKLFLGVLLASAAIGLAACNNGSKNADDSNGTKDVVTEQFTVTFDSKGGSTVAAQTVDKDAKATQPTAPTKTATAAETYTFAGWYTDEAYTTAFDFNTGITANITLYAKWTPSAVMYTVTFNVDGGTTVASQSIAYGGKATRPDTDPTKSSSVDTTKYEFAGWYKDAGKTQLFDFANETITSATTIYAKWTQTDKVAVTFDTKGGNATIQPKYVFPGEAVSQPTETMADWEDANNSYTFVGWYTSTDGGVTLSDTAYNFSTQVTGALTLYAKWTATPIVTYQVTFDVDGGTTVPSQTIREGRTVTEPTVTMTKQADAQYTYTFAGWYADADRTQAFDFGSPITKATTVYAKWNTTVNTYTVTFNYNNGDAATTQTLAYGSKITKPSNPEKAEDNDYTYTFAGWYTTSDFQEGTEFDFNEDTITGATALYAKYTPVAIVRYEVTFDMDGGSAVSTQTVREGYTATEPETEPTKAHDDTYKYTFAGWYADADRTQTFNFGSPITKATTIYAKWTSNLLTKYTVTFDSVGGTAVAAQNIVEDETATKPTNPTKEADIENTYAFAGWYTTSDYQGTEFDFTNTPITEATTLYAKWTATPIAYMAIAINTDNVIKEYTIGDTIDLTGLVVEGKYKGGTNTLTEEYYTVTVTDPSGNAFNIENATEVDGTYTITIQKTGTTSTALKKTFNIVVKKEQYKFNFNLTAEDYNNSLETPYEADHLYDAGTYNLFENKSLKLELTVSGGDQVKLQVGNPRELDGITFNDRFQIHASYGYLSITTKKSGKVTIYCTVGADDGRKIIIKDSDKNVVIEGATTWSKDNLYKIEFDAEAGETYTINSSSKSSVVYAIYFAGSIDKDTRVETDEFEFVPEVTQFDTIDNKFDTTNIAGTASAWDNCGVYRSVALSDITFTVKDSTDTAVTSPITTPGAYTVTATYDGKSVNYSIVVADPNAPITQVIVNSDNATKKFYEGEAAFNANNIVVQGVRDGVTVALSAEDYTIKLYKADTEVTAFDTTGEYTVRVYANDTDVYGSYTINFYQITNTVITSGDTATVKVGTTSFKSCATAELVYADNTTKDITKNIVEKYYIESTCENETTAPFAAAGTVYLQLSVNGAEKVITITVAELTAKEYTYDRTSDNYGISKEGAETPWTTDSYKDGKIATFSAQPKGEDADDGLKTIKLDLTASMTLTLTEASNMIDIYLTGRTSGSNDPKDYLKIEFLDADGNVIDTVIGTTTANKKIGDFTYSAYDNATSFTFTATTACKSIRFSGTTSGKSVGIATATITAYTA